MEKSATTEILNTKTHRRLRKAYCRLLKRMDEKKITVSSLTDEADVSRATFYLYFQNIEEFRVYALQYIISLYTEQIGMFLKAGKQGAKEACKKRNLIFTEDDFELFACLFNREYRFSFDNDILSFAFKNVAKTIPMYFSEKFIRRNHERFNLFYIGYMAVMKSDFIDYHSDKVYRDVIRTIHIWDYLFPDHKFDI